MIDPRVWTSGVVRMWVPTGGNMDSQEKALMVILGAAALPAWLLLLIIIVNNIITN